MSIPPLFRSLLILTATSLYFACSGSTGEAEGDPPGPPTLENACVVPWDAAYGQRMPTGETYFLPLIMDSESCGAISWGLHSAPQASQGELVQGDEFFRFTVDAPGLYEFALLEDGVETGDRVQIEALDALERPFHNYNYFPSSRAVSLVENELWVAGVYSPQIARISPDTEGSLEPVLTGQWPTSLAYAQSEGLVLVTHRASDTLGFIDVATQRQVDALWVGDSPSNVVWDDARGLAYVNLGGANSLAIVDVAKRSLVKTIDTVFDPLAMAVSPDGTTLFVASYRSGQTSMYPYQERDVESEKDIAVIDLESQTVTGYILDFASTIQTLRFNEKGELWSTATTNNVEGSLNDPAAKSFEHQLVQLDPNPGLAQRLQSVDLSRQATSTGSTGAIQGFVPCGESIWVVAEGANRIIELNEDLSESRRIEVLGRPRALTCHDDAVWVVSSNRMEVTRIIGSETTSFSLGLTERRSELERTGLELFAGQGDGPGDNRSCSTCHVDGRSDGVVWNAGPVDNRQLTRPLRWLQGTQKIGWDGYVGSVKITGYVGGSTINHRGNTDEALALGAYLSSIMMSPPANSFTFRDGTLSEEALIGKALFEGKAGCAGCHSGPKFTNRQVLSEGLTPGKTDIPTLVDVADVGSWYKTGIMPTLNETVADTAIKFNVDLSDAEVASVTRYLSELTGRSFFILDEDFGPDPEKAPVDGDFVLTFSYPILDSPENVALITMTGQDDTAVPLELAVDGRHVHMKASSLLEPDSTYTVNVAANFQADDGRLMGESAAYTITTARLPEFSMDGTYELTVGIPLFNPIQGTFDPDTIVTDSSTFVATPRDGGADVSIDYGGDMVYDDIFVLDGTTLITRDLPYALGPAFLNGTSLVAEVVDEDGDGVVDYATGTISLTAPGVDLEDIEVSIIKTAEQVGACPVGTEGDAAPVVTRDGENVTIDWGEEGAIALFVTSPEATLPLGPGPVTGGETYWGLSASSFPATFDGPVEYGVAPEMSEDVSATSGAPVGGAPLESGGCYRFSVVVNFAFSHTTIEWE